MKFEIKDTNWKRYNLFWYYINNLRNVISMTCDIDITGFLNYAKNKGYRFYPCFMWAVSNIINAHDEFKLGWNDKNQVVVYEVIHLYFAHFYKEDEQCVLLVAEYNDDLEIFHKKFCKCTLKNTKITGHLILKMYLQIHLMFLACHGYITKVLIYTYLMMVNTLLLL